MLTARWEHLVMLNYVCPPEYLEPRVPRGVELDPWQGKCFVSVVGFYFADTRLVGIPIPGHRNFEEVNLRFYVRRTMADGERRRAVVFVRELVPRWAIATVARLTHNEPYISVPMNHCRQIDDRGGEVAYGWRYADAEYRLSAHVTGAPQPLVSGSEEEFITEHYWGYNRQRNGSTLEYQVEHPPWLVWQATSSSLTGPMDRLYGPEFGPILSGEPHSAFVALGSPVKVYRGRKLEHQGT